MKIGILTFHCAHNYGAVLQCYATQEFLRSLGHEVEIINYRPKFLLQPYQLFSYSRVLRKNPIRMLKNIIQETLIFRQRYKRWRKFENFIRTHLQCTSVVSRNSMFGDFDAYIVGSDQIWNPYITNGFDSVYFCNFPFKKGDKKYIAYAASMEIKTMSESEKKFLYGELKKFDAISVRERNLQEFLTPLTKLSVYHVLDPTMMVPANIWTDFASSSFSDDRYVLVYEVAYSEYTLHVAGEIAKQLSAKVKIVNAWINYWSRNECNDASPDEFVGLISNAACVVTTSFHATAFSLVLNRPFYTLAQGRDTRSASLLEKLGIQDRMICSGGAPHFTDIDYTEVNVKLDTLRKESQDFLISALSD